MPSCYPNDEQKRLTFQTWKNMKMRCLRPTHATYQDYGARGVTVAPEWLGKGGFVRFLADVGPRPGRLFQLDRPDATKGYGPDNTKWEHRFENLSRPGRERNCGTKLVEAVGPDGEKRKISLRAWSGLLGISYRSLCRRMQRKMGDRAFAVGRRR